MKEYLTKNLVSILVLVLVLVIFLQRCGGNSDTPKNTHDTTTVIQYHYIKDTGYSKPTLISSHRDTTLENTYYLPSDDYEELKNQFLDLKEALLSKNEFRDKLKIDTFGTVDLIDTVQNNRIIGRRFISNLIIPEKVTTITNTIYSKPKTKFFVGGGIGGNQFTPVNDFNLGLAMINKKDQLFEAKGRIDIKGNIYGEINTFWKIKLHK